MPYGPPSQAFQGVSTDQKIELMAIWMQYFAVRAAGLGLIADPLIGTGTTPAGDPRWAALVQETNQVMTVGAYQGALDGVTWGAAGMPFAPPSAPSPPAATTPAATAGNVASAVAGAVAAAVPALSPALTLLTQMAKAS